MRRWICGLAATVAVSATGWAARAAPASHENDPPLSAEDCKVWVAVGQKLYGWGARPADKLQFKIFFRPRGGAYVQQCPWPALGVTPPPIGAYDSAGPYAFFSTPHYAGASATVLATTVYPLPGGQGANMNGTTCSLTRILGRWTVTGCEAGPMT